MPRFKKLNEFIPVLFGLIFLGIQFSFIQDLPDRRVSAEANEPIRIGLLVSNDPAKDSLSLEAIHAVKLAVKKINEEGGVSGRSVELITKSSEADWGAGAKKSVELIYDDKVAAIIGSLNGQNAHLVEMAVAKAQVVFISTRATDPTLSGANIPWFFRVIPNDLQQANQLVTHIYKTKNLQLLAVVSSDMYDHEMGSGSFLRVSRDNGYPEPELYSYEHKKPEFDEIIQSIRTNRLDGISFYGYPEHVKKFRQKMDSSGIQVPLFAPLSILDTADPGLRQYISSHVTHICLDSRFDERAEHFNSQFEEVYGYKPGNIAKYSYDGANVLLESFKAGAFESESITGKLTGISGLSAVTGDITFLENGDVQNMTVVCQ